jgi:hypothetical protein
MEGFTFEDEVSCKTIFACAGCDFPTLCAEFVEDFKAFCHFAVREPKASILDSDVVVLVTLALMAVDEQDDEKDYHGSNDY